MKVAEVLTNAIIGLSGYPYLNLKKDDEMVLQKLMHREVASIILHRPRNVLGVCLLKILRY
ncbi:hypothetical protein AAE02nite_08130 [Adhaeribacter aerolatus]|uniref:Uncharacterized protein n=1 Tax=Adhaeribacter aerolatus TaxID=670289 RepID=A0A512ATU8_9BACT|nr:hypothetical protein AAE02nite_08130 [Adhaeribacter aerolatus]